MQASPPGEQRIPAGVWVLGFVSLLMDVSSEMIHSLLPMFMVESLGISVLAIGLIEGLAEATALLVRVFSGAISDYFGRRKLLAALGYGLGALTKPLFALATGAGWVLMARMMDRVGKGMRGAPRDALIADLAPVEVRGAAFGLRQSLDTVGAFLGPLIAVALMLLLLCCVRETARTEQRRPINPIDRENLRRLGAGYWWVVAVGAIFTLARFSEAFLVLSAGQSGIPVAYVPLAMVAMNLVYAFTAYPFGRLSDRISHVRLLAWGLFALAVADVVLATNRHWSGILLGILLWGLHLGITQGLLSRMVADVAPADLRGTAFGIFGLVSGLAMLLASLLAGLLWEHLGPAYTFLGGLIFCTLALLLLAGRPRMS